MANWLLKTEPEDYSYEDLMKDKKTVWDGVGNNTALMHMRKVKKGDIAFIYHTGKEKQIVGIAEVVSNPYPDPKAENERFVVFDLMPKKKLKTPVTLQEIKSDDRFKDFDLVKISRLSAMPVSDKLWDTLLKLSEK